ncbi:MAG: efflux RND transporter periplasmic adaptor subunit [Gemmatimonadales bacterium]|nr:efflux RND transporter periplasmic adaptor subunit [Gemmatimonadales bacterium]
MRPRNEAGARRGHQALLAALLLLPLTGCNSDEADTAGAAPPPAVIGPENIAVAIDTVLTAGPTLSGTLEPELAATLRAELGGAVTDLLVDDGQAVKRGQVLVRLDDSAVRDDYLSARAALRSADATSKVARRNAERAARLKAAGAVAEREVEDAETSATSAEGQVADARARLASAEKQLAKTVLRAPFNGIVAEVTVSEGDVVQSGASLLTVIDPATLRLEASVPAEAIAAVKAGTPVQFTVTGFESRSFGGKIQRVSPAVDPATRQVRVIASLDNAERSLVAGLFAEGRAATERRPAIVVPRAAIDNRGIRPFVVRLEGGRIERIEVETGLQDRVSERIEVRKGIAAGDTVLTGGAAGLPPGSPATVRVDQPGPGSS